MSNKIDTRVVNSVLVHELKTPLNAIIGFADLILDDDSFVNVKEYAEIVKSNGSDLLNKIQDVLEFNKILKDEEYYKEEFRLIDVLEELFIELKKEIRKSGNLIILKKYIPNKKLSNTNINTNKLIFKRIVYHAFLSAISKKNVCTITIGYSEEINGDILFFISNNPSIENQISELITSNNRFYYENAIDYYGVEGLNIAICKVLCEKIGTDLWVDRRVDISTYVIKISL